MKSGEMYAHLRTVPCGYIVQLKNRNRFMSQQEDDLRALAKIMDFLRAVSIILVVIHLYWYCYEAVRLWGIDIGVVDRVLINFDRTARLFHHILYTKLFALVLLRFPAWARKASRKKKSRGEEFGWCLPQGWCFSFLTGGYCLCLYLWKPTQLFMRLRWRRAMSACSWQAHG